MNDDLGENNETPDDEEKVDGNGKDLKKEQGKKGIKGEVEDGTIEKYPNQ